MNFVSKKSKTKSWKSNLKKREGFIGAIKERRVLRHYTNEIFLSYQRKNLGGRHTSRQSIFCDFQKCLIC